MKDKDMKATHSNSATFHKRTRRDWKRPSRDEVRPVGEWEAEVRAKKNGRWNSTLNRKVLIKGIQTINAGNVLERAIRLLRQGYEVRLLDADGNQAVRLYQCVDKNFEKMFVSARTMGEFRQSLNDIKFHASNKDGELDVEEVAHEQEQKLEEIRNYHSCVTPDLTMICDVCGNVMRVGQKLAK